MKEQRKHLTEEELKRFLKGIESTRDRAIFTVSYWRGLRAAEPGQLKLSDWDRNAQRPSRERFGVWASAVVAGRIAHARSVDPGPGFDGSIVRSAAASAITPYLAAARFGRRLFRAAPCALQVCRLS